MAVCSFPPVSKHGFSLVELSIVLVILGLLTGGILAGKSLIRASELRAVSVEYQRYFSATGAFRDKYFGLPGDINNATTFWGKDNTNCSWCTGTTATPGTCNGGGDNVVNTYDAEQHRFWQHLVLAGLIEGNYTGLAGAGGVGEVRLGTNAPASKLPSAGWGAVNFANFAGDAGKYAMDYGNGFLFGAFYAGHPPFSPILKPEEAWNIDQKLDDGKPAAGKVIATNWNNACAAADDGSSANNDLVASYLVSSSSVQCSLFFRQLF